jgi:hypothetical protein
VAPALHLGRSFIVRVSSHMFIAQYVGNNVHELTYGEGSCIV